MGEVHITYPKITEILAEISATFSVLLAVGAIG